MKYVVNVEEMRALEQNAIHGIGIPEEVLMERAAYAVWQELERQTGAGESVLFLCGTGNNGGDGLAVARMAYLGGRQVSVAIVSKDGVQVFGLAARTETFEGKSGDLSGEAARPEKGRDLSGDADGQECFGSGGRQETGADSEKTEKNVELPPHCSEGFAGQFSILQKICKFAGKDRDLAEYTIVVDAVFGIGLFRPVTGTYRECLLAVQREKLRRKLKVISVDIPSGISADTGRVMGTALKADLTVTFGWEKPGLLLCPGAQYAGRVVTADIGIPPEASILSGSKSLYGGGKKERADSRNKDLSDSGKPMADPVPGGGAFRRLEPSDILSLPARDPDTHKGDYGKIAVIAGSDGMCGAAMLAAKAAYRAGAGIVSVVSAKENRIPIQTALPEAIFAARDRAEERISWADCIAIGPGLGTDEEAARLVRLALASGKPVVADADALNCISKSRAESAWVNDTKMGEEGGIPADTGETADLYSLLHNQVILTPHVGEMARLTGLAGVEIRENPAKAARRFAAEYGCICVLKGARTIISDGVSFHFMNTSGNAGMAVGGSGDVLTGIIGGLLATERDVRKAAVLGVYVHGLAGDRAAGRLGERSMTAADLLDGIAPVFREESDIS